MNKLQPYFDEWELLTAEEKTFVANGCGPKFGILGAIVPDFGDIFTPACNLHDWVYWSGGPVENRIYADEKFRQDLDAVVNSMSWWKRWLLSWVPKVYYVMVRRLGNFAWHEAPLRRTRIDLQREMRNASI